MSTTARQRVGRSWVVLVTAMVLALLTILLLLSGLLVRLSNDREGKPILPPQVNPGDQVAGEVVLTDTGLLPLTVSLEPRFADGAQPASLPKNVDVSIQRVNDGAYLYKGPLTYRMGPFASLGPGQATKFRLTVASSDSHAQSAVPLGYSWYWSAQPALPRWWWIPVAVAALGFAAWVWRGRKYEEQPA
jgi:hypothetical protein